MRNETKPFKLTSRKSRALFRPSVCSTERGYRKVRELLRDKGKGGRWPAILVPLTREPPAPDSLFLIALAGLWPASSGSISRSIPNLVGWNTMLKRSGDERRK